MFHFLCFLITHYRAALRRWFSHTPSCSQTVTIFNKVWLQLTQTIKKKWLIFSGTIQFKVVSIAANAAWLSPTNTAAGFLSQGQPQQESGLPVMCQTFWRGRVFPYEAQMPMSQRVSWTEEGDCRATGFIPDNSWASLSVTKYSDNE